MNWPLGVIFKRASGDVGEARVCVGRADYIFFTRSKGFVRLL